MSVQARAADDDRRPAARGPEQLAAVLESGGGELRALLAETERRLAEVAVGHGETLTRHASETLAAGGKRLRPLLVFICAGAASDARLVDAAVAVELLHMATLVHDDVLDRATLRRGRPTVFASAGPAAATAAGDLLFARAFSKLVGTGEAAAVQALASASAALVRGELMQRADAWSTSVTRARYIERCALKTARLFEAACRVGASLGEPDADAAAALAAYGARIGIAFQIFDDVLDVAGPAERTGKPRGTDLLDGTVTLPLIVALERDPELARLDLRDTIKGPVQAEAFCDRIARSGALDEAREQALAYVAQAKVLLSGLRLPERQRRTLELVADGVVERYS